jgi:AraC-like DNA-binding protein
VHGLTVDRQSAGGIWWESARRPPDPRLAGLVTDVMGYAEFSERPVARRVTPHPAVTVIINLGPPIALDGALLGSFAAGLQDSWGITEFSGAQQGMELRLTPQGARRLLDVPPAELAGQVVDRPVLDRLASRLADTQDWATRLDLLEAELMRLASEGPEPDPVVGWAWRAMRRHHGNVRIGDLVAETGWSRRHFVSRFRAEVGLPPKVAARMLRFNRASRLLANGVPAAVVSAGCGYTDQSHLVREFRALAGVTPGAFVAELDAEQVTFLQDGDRADLLASSA